MFVSKIIAPALFAASVLAQGYDYGTTTTSAVVASAAAVSDTLVVVPTAPAGQVAVQVVKVSDKGGDLKFIPDNIQAPIGSMIQFQFYPKNHTVVQSNFANPCVPLAQSNATAGPGFFSGFMPVTAGATIMPTFTIMVNTLNPVWFYCSQAKHCQGGMVGVINAPAGSTAKNIDTFKAAAMLAPENISPSDDASAAAVSSTTAAGYSTTLMTASSTSTTTANPAQATTAGGATFKLSGLGMVIAALGAVLAV